MFPFIVPEAKDVIAKIGEAAASPQPLSEVNFLIWNVYKGNRAQVFEKDFRQFGGGKDFFFLQEALLDQRMPALWKENFSGYEWHLAQSFRYGKDQTGTGVAIGSMYTPTNVEFLRSQSREFFWLTPKLSLFSEYDLGGKKVLFVCTHVLNFVTTGMFSRALYEIAQRISQFEGPVVLAGDFNTWNLKRMMIMKSIFRDLKLEHLELDQDRRLLKLDHVFVRGFQILKAQLLQTKGSDHLPIEIKIKL